MQTLFRTITGNHYVVSRFSKVIGQGTFKIDATQSPKTIDSTPACGGFPPSRFAASTSSTATGSASCNAQPGQPRPKNFGAKMYTGHMLIEWQPEVK